jgi:hypothetical protein
MNHNLNRIERLDSAARALAALPLFSWGGLVVLWYPLIKMWIWRDEAWIVPHVATTHLWAVIVVVAIIPTVMVLIRQSYAINPAASRRQNVAHGVSRGKENLGTIRERRQARQMVLQLRTDSVATTVAQAPPADFFPRLTPWATLWRRYRGWQGCWRA